VAKQPRPSPTLRLFLSTRHAQSDRDLVLDPRAKTAAAWKFQFPTGPEAAESYECVASSDFPALLQLFAEFQANEPMMQSMAKRERWERLITRIALAIAVLALIGESIHFFL
jgi:hypothetical protein